MTSSATPIETLHIGAVQIDIIDALKDGRTVRTARVSGNDILPKRSLLAQCFGNPQQYELLHVDMLGVNQRHYRITLPDSSFIELRIDDKLDRKRPTLAHATIEFRSKHHVARRADGLPTSYLVELINNIPQRVVERWHHGNNYTPNAQGVIERLTKADGTPLHSETLIYGDKAQFRVRRTIIKSLGFRIAAEVWVMNDRHQFMRHSPTLWPRLQPDPLELNKERKKWRLTRRYSPSTSRIAWFIVTHLILGRTQDKARKHGWPLLNEETSPVRGERKWLRRKLLSTHEHPPLYTGAKPTGPT